MPSRADGQEICPRCRGAVARNAKSCPACGERLAFMRRVPIFVGIAGVLALIFAAVMMFTSAQNEDEADKPTVPVQDQPSAVKPPPLNK